MSTRQIFSARTLLAAAILIIGALAPVTGSSAPIYYFEMDTSAESNGVNEVNSNWSGLGQSTPVSGTAFSSFENPNASGFGSAAAPDLAVSL